jgi:hypothetical protein
MSYVLFGVKYRAQGQLELDLSADIQALKASIGNPASPPQCMDMQYRTRASLLSRQAISDLTSSISSLFTRHMRQV